MNKEVYQYVTDAILERLEAGDVPWRKPWKYTGEAGSPRNFISGKPYRGVNVWLLAGRYDLPFWLSFKQAQEIGAKVRKGEKSSLVVFWSIVKKASKVKGEEPTKIFLLRYYRVFNVAQIEGISDERLEAAKRKFGIVPDPNKPAFDPIEAAQRLIDGFADKPQTTFGGERAVYYPFSDVVELPNPSDFTSREEFYSTAFHEYVHSTGHAKRLAREGVTKPNAFGSNPYAREELVAEFGAAFLDGLAGIEAPLLDNSASYIAGWSKALRADPSLFVSAAGQAQKAVDYIQHGKVSPPGGDTEESASLEAS